MVKLDFTDAGQYVRQAKSRNAQENTTPQGVEIFRASGYGKRAASTAKSFTSRSRRIVHSRPKNKTATLFKPELRELSSKADNDVTTTR